MCTILSQKQLFFVFTKTALEPVQPGQNEGKYMVHSTWSLTSLCQKSNLVHSISTF